MRATIKDIEKILDRLNEVSKGVYCIDKCSTGLKLVTIDNYSLSGRITKTEMYNRLCTILEYVTMERDLLNRLKTVKK